ncbi:hypothetical protein Btru_013229 [Bulinus truncatus]|nr:hypothetical protein Btru_013229 [Bulinus truncatus]
MVCFEVAKHDMRTGHRRKEPMGKHHDLKKSEPMFGTDTMTNTSDSYVTYFVNGITNDDIEDHQIFESRSTSFNFDVTTSTVTTTTTATETTTPCSMRDISCDALLIAANYFTVYGTYIAYAVGIPGNLLTCLILAKMRPFNSSIIWLIVLTFADLINLAIRFIYSRALVSGPDNREYWVEWSCRFFYIVTGTCGFSSYLFVVGLTFERFIAVQFPLKMNQWCTIRRSVFAVVVCLVICVSQSMYVVEVYRVNSLNLCVMREKYKNTWNLIYETYFQTTLFSLLPIVLLVLLNCLIVRRLLMARELQKKMSESENKSKSRQQKQVNKYKFFFRPPCSKVVIEKNHMLKPILK